MRPRGKEKKKAKKELNRCHEKVLGIADSLKYCHATAESPLIESASASSLSPLGDHRRDSEKEYEEDEERLRRLSGTERGPKAAISSGSTNPSKAKNGQPWSSLSSCLASSSPEDGFGVVSDKDVGSPGAWAIAANFRLSLSSRAACATA